MKRIYQLAAFLIPLVVYILTAYPDLTFTDNGELAAASASLGVAHPTGYPLFMILSHLWSFIQISDSLIRHYNLFSSFFTALSALMFFNWTREIFLSLKFKNINIDFMSLIASLNYAFGIVIWQQGLSFEVYSLHLFMINSIFYFIFKGDRELNRRAILTAALFIGLSFANHLTTILLIPVLIYMHFYKRDVWDFNKTNFTNSITPGLLVLLGLTLYIYLPIRSSQEALFDWGGVSRSWDKFIYHVSGKQYQVWMFSGMDSFKEGLGKFASSITNDLINFTGIIPAVIGLTAVFKRNRRIAFALIIIFLSCLIYSANYSIHDIEIYFALSYMVIHVLTFAFIASLIDKNYSKFYSVFVVLPIASLIMNYSTSDHSDDYMVRDYTNILLENVEENAIIISSQWDIWNAPFWYIQQIEGYRKDVILIEKEIMRRTWYPDQLLQWYPDLEMNRSEIEEYMVELKKFENEEAYDVRKIQATFLNVFNSIIDSNIDKRPIYITVDVLHGEQGIADKFMKVPQGFAFKLDKFGVSYVLKPSELKVDRLLKYKPEKPNHLEESLYQTAAINMINLGRYGRSTNQIDSANACIELANKLNFTPIIP